MLLTRRQRAVLTNGDRFHGGLTITGLLRDQEGKSIRSIGDMAAAPFREWSRIGGLLVLTAALVPVAACSDSRAVALQAYEEGRAALVLGDLPTARDAFARAVRAREDVAEAWNALGQVQLRLRNYSDAYYAYSRAVELDRGNAQALQVMSQIALLSDRLDEASRLASQLEVLEPGGNGAVTVRGYIALKRGRLRDAMARADGVLVKAPEDMSATVLKALVLERSGRPESAGALLEDYLARNGENQTVLQNLLGIHERRLDQAAAARTLGRLAALSPSDKPLAYRYARALFDAGEKARARQVSAALLRSNPPPGIFAEVLKLWLGYLPRSEALQEANALQASDRSRRLNLARFYIEAGEPARSERIIAADARLPVTGATADPVAVLAHARAAQGRSDEAEKMLNEVLAFDATNIVALRGRADLYLEAGRTNEALVDAQRLVSENPRSPEDRLRLVQAYERRGDKLLAEQELWRAFGDVPASPLLYERLKRQLRRDKRYDAVVSLEQRYSQQRRRRAGLS